MRLKTLEESYGRFILPGLCLIGFGLRIYQLAGSSLWWDEMATVARTAVSLEEMFANLLTVRNHMPLYFLLMRPWSEIGRSAFVMRYTSVVWGTLAIPLIYQLGRLNVNKKTGLTAAALLTISPFHVWFSQELRMYSLLLLVVLSAHWFLARALSQPLPGNWAGYGLAMLAALYLHYMAALILLVHYIFFSLHHRFLKPYFKPWLLSAGTAGFFFALWVLPIMLTGGFRDAPIGWIPPAYWFDPFQTFLAFSLGPTIDPAQIIWYVVLLAFVVGILVVWRRYGRLPRAQPEPADLAALRPYLFARLLFLWLLIPLGVLFLISLDLPIPQKRAVYVDRYLIISLPAFLLLAAWGFALLSVQKRGRWVAGLAGVIILAVTFLSLNNMFYRPQYARADWRGAIRQIQTSWQPGDLLLITPAQILPLAYYDDGGAARRILPEEAAEMSSSLVEGGRRIWVIGNYANINKHGFPQDRNKAQTSELADYTDWLSANLEQQAEFAYPGIRVFLYRHPDGSDE